VLRKMMVPLVVLLIGTTTATPGHVQTNDDTLIHCFVGVQAAVGTNHQRE